MKKKKVQFQTFFITQTQLHMIEFKLKTYKLNNTYNKTLKFYHMHLKIIIINYAEVTFLNEKYQMSI